MRDVHCHMLFGVDDGSASLDESLLMLRSARQAGITQVVCTPHCRGRHFDADLVHRHFEELRGYAHPIEISLGYEVYVNKLLDIGLEHARDYRFGDSDDFLLELPVDLAPANLETVVYRLQGQGLRVIIAHPERYTYVQHDIEYAYGLINMGCRLQTSADFVRGGLFSAHAKCAKALLKNGLISFIASDAHEAADYDDYAAAMRKYASVLR